MSVQQIVSVFDQDSKSLNR